MQLVNFYFDQYKPKPLSFDARFAMFFVSVVALGLIVFGVIQSSQVSKFESNLKAKQKQAADLLEQTMEIQKRLAKNPDAKSLDNRLNTAKHELLQYQKAIQSILPANESTAYPYSEILLALAERKASNVWLTEISIGHQLLSLKGATLDSKAIPLYVDDLKNAQPLSREFDELTIIRDEQNKQVVNFALINGRALNER